MKTINEVVKACGMIRQNFESVELTGLQVSRTDFESLLKRGEELAFYRDKGTPTLKGFPVFLVINGVTITKAPPAISLEMLNAGARAIESMAENGDRKLMALRVYQSMLEVKESEL